MNLRERIAALRRDIAQTERDKRLESRWRHELIDALAEQSHTDHSQPVPRDGVDYAWGRPSPGKLRAAGVTFVLRYLGGSPDKDLTRLEAEDLSHAGLDLGVVWEGGAEAALGGAEAGARDARMSVRQGEGCGLLM